MLKNVSRLVLKQSTAIGLSLLAAGATATALAQSPPAPVLIPYTSTLVAGYSGAITGNGGYSGDGGKAAGTYLNGTTTLAVDPEGNVYISDTANAVIREVNAQTGLIKIIAGLPPTKCTLTTCTAQSGLVDNVPATSAAIGTGTRGLAVDGFGNVFFDDYNQNVIRVIYKGGAQVANLIALEDPGAASSASMVVPGNVYLIGGVVPAGATSGTKGATDKLLATKALIHDPAELQLDAAGNIYFEDFGNNVIRVINAQSTTQTFFGVTLQPGYIGAIVDCGSLTTACGSAYTGVSPGAADYGADLAAQALGVDQYGNVYEVNTKGAASIFGGVAYNGMGPLTKLLTLVLGYTPVAGDFYNVINGNPASATVPAIPLVTPYPVAVLANQYNNIVLRASAITIDQKGNIYYLDNHFPWIFRIDVNSQVGTKITGSSATTGGSVTTPVRCNFTSGVAYAPTESLQIDGFGDGCPSTAAVIGGNGAMATDAAGNLYLADSGENLVREFSVNSQFPSSPVGTPVTQTLQVHFDQTNLPLASITTAPTTTAPLAIQTGDTDFTIATAPTCASNTTSLLPPTQTTTGPLDGSIDCWVQVTFNPSAPGRRTGNLQATVSSGAVYNIALTGVGSGVSLALDGGGQSVVPAAGLGAVTGIAVDAAGNKFIADPANNRVVELPAQPANAAQTTVGTGLSAPQGVAVDIAGNVYIADTGNNRIVMVSSNTPATASTSGSAQTVLGSGFTAPQGVAVDPYGNVYVADTGNARVVEIPADTAQSQATLFQFTTNTPIISDPVTIAVDSLGNVYVGDPMAKKVYEIPPGGGDMQNIVSSASQLRVVPAQVTNPSGLAVDAAGDVYVSDATNNVVVETPSSTGPGATLFNLSFSGLKSPAGLAIDGFGNVYVADSGNSRVLEMVRNLSLTALVNPTPAASSTTAGSTATFSLGSPSDSISGTLSVAVGTSKPVTATLTANTTLSAAVTQLNAQSTFSGASLMASVGTGSNANQLIITGPADTGTPGANTLVLTGTVVSDGATPTVNYGQLGVFQPAVADTLTLTNIGTQSVTLSSPAFVATGTTADFTLADSTSLPCSGTLLFAGLTCTFNSTFLPMAAGSYSETAVIQGGTGNGGVTATIEGVGVAPLAAIVTTLSTPPVAGVTTAAATATVTQPHGVNTPTGTVTFVYTVNEGNTARGGSTTTVTVPLVSGSNGAATAVLNLTGLLPARRYSIVATYNGDPGDTANTATALTFTVPGGTTLSVIANPVTFAYGSAVPALTGTVTGILPADSAAITYSFITTASSTTNVGTYPITLLLNGGNYLNYVVPPAVTTSGAPALVTETRAPLSVKVNNATSVYGSPNITNTSVITGAVNGDQFNVQYTPASSSVLNVATYTLVPTVTGAQAANYTITTTNGTLTITPAGTSSATTANAASLTITPSITTTATTLLVTTPPSGTSPNGSPVLSTNLSSEQVSVTIASATSGTPSGTVTLTDTFTPFSTGVALAPVSIGPLTLTPVPGTPSSPSTTSSTTYTPTSPTPGIHAYTVAYSGSTNYQASTNAVPIYVIVDHPDFFLTAPTSPLVVIPGTLPGGNQTITGESAANPEQATVTITPILNYTGTVTVSCASPSSYVSCGFTNIASTSIGSTASVTINTATAQTTTLNVQTAATLPANYTGSLRRPSKVDYTLAFLPFGMLAMLPFVRARRKKLTRYVWLLVLFFAMGFGLSGCTTTNLVKFYTPVPEGVQSLTITATDGTITQTFTMSISIQ
jgi:sugar lactone lactonase YvrE